MGPLAHRNVPLLVTRDEDAKMSKIIAPDSTNRKASHELSRLSGPLFAACDQDVVHVKAGDAANTVALP